MRSAIYYPRTQVHSVPIMKTSLLLWDKLHTIVPMPAYRTHYGADKEMAEAWAIIGSQMVPSAAQKGRAHDAIETTLRAGVLPRSLWPVAEVDGPKDDYEIWPQKFSVETWDLLLTKRVTRKQLPNGDYPVTQEGGLLLMAKLADACAGTQFARVTDRLIAYGMIGTGDGRPGVESEVVPITLDLIDAASIPIENLIELRRREVSERRGHDYTRMRHNYADMVKTQAALLGTALDQGERDEMNRQFRDTLKVELKDLQDALRFNILDHVLKPVVTATIVTAGSFLAGAAAPIAIAAGIGSGIGGSLPEYAKAASDFLSGGFSFNRKQRETMAKNPMAYLYSASKV